MESRPLPAIRDCSHDGLLCTYIYYITVAGNSISSQPGSSCQDNRYGTARQAIRPLGQSIKVQITCQVLQLSKAGRCVGLALYDNASSLATYNNNGGSLRTKFTGE
jgi:hypothetical protein